MVSGSSLLGISVEVGLASAGVPEPAAAVAAGGLAECLGVRVILASGRLSGTKHLPRRCLADPSSVF